MKLAVQLWTLRRDYEGADGLLDILGKVKELGFDGVEFAGTAGLSAQVLKARLDDLGLVPVGAHAGIADFEGEKLTETLEFYKKLGCKKIGTGYAPHETLEAAQSTVKILSAAAEKAKEYGLNIYYHNHSSEFKATAEGKIPMDLIKEKLLLELDTFWSFHADIDTPAFIRENAGRISLIHIKDGKNGVPKALGEGENNLSGIVDAVKYAGIDWLVLENDEPVPTGLEDIGRSMKWLKANI